MSQTRLPCWLQDGSAYGVYSQTISADGVKLGQESQADINTIGNQKTPRTVSLPNGNFVVVWESSADAGIWMREYGSAGLPLSEAKPLSSQAGGRDDPVSSHLENSSIAIAWNSTDESGDGVFWGEISVDQVESFSFEKVNQFTAGRQNVKGIEALSDRKVAVVWDSFGQDGSGYGAYLRVFDTQSETSTEEFRISPSVVGDQNIKSTLALSSGVLLVAWRDVDRIWISHFGSSGARTESDLLLSEDIPISAHLEFVELNDGRILVLRADGNSSSILGRVFDSVDGFDGKWFVVINELGGRVTGLNSSTFGNDFISVAWSQPGTDGDGFGIYSMQLSLNSLPTGSISLSGDPVLRSVLTANIEELDDRDGLGTFSYQWLRDGAPVLSATSSTYTLTQEDVGSQISVEVSYIDGGGTAESVTSDQTAAVLNINDGPVGSIVISGNASEGETLTADASGVMDGDGINAATVEFQWLRDGSAITDATLSTYELTQDDIGSAISVRYSYTDNFGTAEIVTNSPTVAVTNTNDVPTGFVAINGTVSQGETLTVDTSNLDDVDGFGTFSFVWLRDGTAILEVTEESYELTQADVGSQISVEVSYIDGGGTAESVTSTATNPVVNVNDDPTGSINIAGTVSQGEILTADTSGLDDPDGLGAFSYVWLRDGNPILGATASSYELTQDDVGTAISVQVAYSDGYGTAESVVSDPTQAVASNDETLEGDDGDNTLSGGDGEDTLSGGSGNDTLEGGPDADRFVIKLGDEQITILDFELGMDILDLLDFDRADALSAFYNAQSGSAILTFGDGTIVTVEGDGVSPDTLTIDDVEFAAGNLRHSGFTAISGDAIWGQTLTAEAISVSDGDGFNPATAGFQWTRDYVPIQGATTNSYVLTFEDVGTRISVIYSFTDNFGTVESLESSATPIVSSGMGNLEIGTPEPDVIFGSLRSDTIQGLAGDDTIGASAGNDQIDGGEGIDTVNYSGNQTSYTLTLSELWLNLGDARH